MVSSKYCTGNSVVVPSQAAGVKIGVSARMKPSPLKKSRMLLITSCRTRRIAVWRSARIHRCRRSIRKSTPCSFGVIGKSCASLTTSMPVAIIS